MPRHWKCPVWRAQGQCRVQGRSYLNLKVQIPVAGWVTGPLGMIFWHRVCQNKDFQSQYLFVHGVTAKKGWILSKQISFLDKFPPVDLCRSRGSFFPHIFSPLGILNINLPCTIGILSWIFPLFVCFSITQKITASWWKHLVTWAFSNRNLLSEGIQRAASTGNQKQSWLEWGSLFDIKCEIAA